MQNISKKNSYYKYLDGYRFIAVFLVILSHWIPSYFGNAYFGKIGVDLFFVLSGFLITEILLKQRVKVEKHADSTSRLGVFKMFYIRRALRIFPIYYLLILIFFVLGAPDLLHHIKYYLLYGANYLLIVENSWLGMFTHLWSLAVEEQFYLVWPFFILYVPNRILKQLILILIVISLLFVLYISRNESIFQRYNLISCLNVLGLGGLLAFVKHNGNSLFKRTVLDHVFFWPSFAMLILYCLKIFTNYVVLQITLDVFAFLALKFLLTSNKKWLDLILNNAIISFLGKISYGLYLYHNFIPWFLRNLNGTEKEFVVIKNMHLPEPTGFMSIFAVQFILLVLIAVASWFIIEKPINSLKNYFPYVSNINKLS